MNIFWLSDEGHGAKESPVRGMTDESPARSSPGIISIELVTGSELEN